MRVKSEALDSIIGKPFKVLDDGFVRLIDYMGDDSSIVQAARVSYGVGTKKVSEDKNLIRYLMRHHHTTPFEMCELKIHVRVPMDCWRQWIRHRTASVNEYSTRYSEAIDSMQKTKSSEWRLQGKGNKQGSEGFVTEWSGEYKKKHPNHFSDEEPVVDPGYSLSFGERVLHQEIREEYKRRLEMGVAREQARKDLPLSTYTEAYWKCNLKNLLHFLALRMDSHAQQEIREYATIIGEKIVAPWVPVTWEAFNDYHGLRGAQEFTALELRILEHMLVPAYRTAMDEAAKLGWLKTSKKTGKLLRNRERSEFEEKLEKLGVKAPWR